MSDANFVITAMLIPPAVHRLELRTMVRRAGPNPSKADAVGISQKREGLMKRIEKFQQHAIRWLGTEAIDLMREVVPDPGEFTIPDGMDEEDSPERADTVGPERLPLFMPSTMTTLNGTPPEIVHLAEKELEMRKGRANDALHSLRVQLGKKSFHFRERLRPAVGKVQKTRAWAAIQAVNAEISQSARVYAFNRTAMIDLGIGEAQLTTTYRDLQASDLITSTAILQPNLPGQSTQRLSWIWTQHLSSADDDTHLSECKLSRPLLRQTNNMTMHSVYRVHWLRSRAQLLRWEEEQNLTMHEMVWSTGYFMYQVTRWSTWKQETLAAAAAAAAPGKLAYAEKQMHRWRMLALNADAHYVKLVPKYSELI